MLDANHLISLIKECKKSSDEAGRLRIPVRMEADQLIGWLECVDSGLVGSEQLVGQLTKWRRMFMRYFLTQFDATENRTRKWLEEVVIPSSDRLLFIILTDDEQPIGNFGVCGISPATAELDNLIRGERGGHPRLVFYAELTLLKWLFERLQIREATLHVFSTNSKTISLHSEVGFAEIERVGLYGHKNAEGEHYSPNAIDGELAPFSYVRMSIGREDFHRRYTWLNCGCNDGDEGVSLGLSYRDQAEWNAKRASRDKRVLAAAQEFVVASAPHRYAYNFEWLGRPIIQFPQDMLAMQEIIWRVRPDVIVETGVAHGGSLVFYASIMELLGHGRVIGVDIEIRPHNRAAIEAHPMARRIDLVEGSSTAASVFKRVRELAGTSGTAIVVLDSNHTHEHVLSELHAYADLVSVGSYCVVMDTVVEDMPADFFPDRPWSVGNNPKTAVRAFLAQDNRFEIDSSIPAKLLITVAPDGYLRRVR